MASPANTKRNHGRAEAMILMVRTNPITQFTTDRYVKGIIKSTVDMSLENLFNRRPTGVASKKLIGHLMTLFINCACSDAEDLIPAIVKARAATMVPIPRTGNDNDTIISVSKIIADLVSDMMCVTPLNQCLEI